MNTLVPIKWEIWSKFHVNPRKANQRLVCRARGRMHANFLHRRVNKAICREIVDQVWVIHANLRYCGSSFGVLDGVSA